jgi:hypothetical protein
MTVETFYYNFKNKLGLVDVLKQLDPTKLWRIRFDEYDEKTRLQEEKYHAMLGDIARQAKHLNKVLELDDWKRLCVKQFADDCISQNVTRLADYWIKNQVRLMPSLDGSSLVALGQQTRTFPKYVAAGFITWLYSYGNENNIQWTEPVNQYEERMFA